MPNRDFAAASAALGTIIEPQVVSQINRAVVMARVLGVQPADNQKVTWDVRLGTSVGAPIADGADVSTYNADTRVPASIDYGEYNDSFAITGRAMAAAMATRNPEQLANIFIEDMSDSVERLAFGIGADVYTGTGATDRIWGLYGGAATPLGITGTYAGISRGTYSQWQSNVVDAGGKPASTGLLRDLRRKIYTASGMKHDLFICDPLQHQAIGEAMGVNRQQVDYVRRNDGMTIKLDAGYNALSFDGITVLEDVQHPAQTITAINTSFVRLRQLPAPPADIIGQQGSPIVIGGTPDEQLGPGRTNVQAFVIPFAKTGNLHKFGLYAFIQLQVKRPNTCGSIINLPASY